MFARAVTYHPRTRPLAHARTHSPAHPLTHTRAHSSIHSLTRARALSQVGEHIGNASLSLGWVQSAENLGRVPLCARCASVIGTPAELLAAAASIEPPPEVLMGMRSAAAGRGDWEVRGDSGRESAGLPAPAPASSATAATQPLVQCELGCGQAYCSLECEEEDSVEGVHAQLCCG